MFEIIFAIISVLIFSIFSAGFGWFFDFCIGEPHHGIVKKGRIFSAYGSFILRKYFEREKSDRPGLNWWKMAGACPACSNAWLCFLQYPVIVWYLGFGLPEMLIFFFPFMVTSNGILRKLISSDV